jgi:hypothetical protein
MKIAVCLSGHSRNYKKNHPNFQFDADVFIATNWQSGLPDGTGLDYISYHSQDSPQTNLIDLPDILEKYNPQLYTISNDYIMNEQLSMLNTYKTAHGAKLSQIGQMFHKINESNNLRKTYEEYHKIKYEYVIRSRFDVKINNIKFDTSKILLWRDVKSSCDLFFAGSPVQMDRICNIYDWFIYQDPLFLSKFDNAERILKYYIDLLDIESMIDNAFDISFTKDSPIQTTEIKNGEKIIIYGK